MLPSSADLLPIFSVRSTPLHGDILVPGLDSVDFERDAENDIKWRKKEGRLYWRRLANITEGTTADVVKVTKDSREAVGEPDKKVDLLKLDEQLVMKGTDGQDPSTKYKYVMNVRELRVCSEVDKLNLLPQPSNTLPFNYESVVLQSSVYHEW